MKSHFTPEQLNELETVYGLIRMLGKIKVRDGFVSEDDLIWWRQENGPERVKVSDHLNNIKNYPEIYQINEPIVLSVEYKD